MRFSHVIDCIRCQKWTVNKLGDFYRCMILNDLLELPCVFLEYVGLLNSKAVVC